MLATQDTGSAKTFRMPRELRGPDGNMVDLTKPQLDVIDVIRAMAAYADDRGIAFVRQADLSADLGIDRRLVINAIRNAEAEGLLVTVVDRHQMTKAMAHCKGYEITAEGYELLVRYRMALIEEERSRKLRSAGLERFPTDAELGLGGENGWI